MKKNNIETKSQNRTDNVIKKECILYKYVFRIILERFSKIYVSLPASRFIASSHQDGKLLTMTEINRKIYRTNEQNRRQHPNTSKTGRMLIESSCNRYRSKSASSNARNLIHVLVRTSDLTEFGRMSFRDYYLYWVIIAASIAVDEFSG